VIGGKSALDPVAAELLRRHLAGEVGLRRVVHQHRIAAQILDLGRGAVALGLGLRQSGDARLDPVAHLRR
jgi:hypothetical protein